MAMDSCGVTCDGAVGSPGTRVVFFGRDDGEVRVQAEIPRVRSRERESMTGACVRGGEDASLPSV